LFALRTGRSGRPGELGAGEELGRHLWPEDTFVDFEHSLNTHIKKLRHVLDDNAETPRYIETLPRRGYRFIAKVEAVSNGNGAHALAVGEIVQPPAESPSPPFIVTSPPVQLPSRESVPSASPRRRKYAAAVAIVAAVGVAAIYWIYRPRTPYVTGMHQLTQSGRPKSLMGLHRVVTDGARIYFDEFDGNTWHIAQVSVRGGDVSYIDTPLIQHPRLADISDDGSELLVSSDLGTKESNLPHKQIAFWTVQLPSGEGALDS
jgi:hypothetical protein